MNRLVMVSRIAGSRWSGGRRVEVERSIANLTAPRKPVHLKGESVLSMFNGARRSESSKKPMAGTRQNGVAVNQN